MEIWKKVIGFEEYEVSNYGKLRNIQTGRFFDRKPHHSGYTNVTLRVKGEKHYTSIHRLVAIHFIDNPNNYSSVNHKDGNKANNHYLNLEWCTQKQNVEHAIQVLNYKPKFSVEALAARKEVKTKHKPGRMVVQMSTGIVFENVGEAAKCFQLLEGTIRDHISGRYSNKYDLAYL